MHPLLEIILSTDDAVRHAPLESFAATASVAELQEACTVLERFRGRADNLYQRVRALFFLHAIHRYHLPAAGLPARGRVPFDGYRQLLERDFEGAIECFRAAAESEGASQATSSALAEAYRGLAFQTLAGQVRRSVRAARGNEWMFGVESVGDHPLRVVPELLERSGGGYPVLVERTPVRLDLSHSAWSDIFFLGMDYPEGARVLNVSIDLGVRGRDREPRPPIAAYLRVTDRPVLRLCSVDLGATADVTTLDEVFDFARDYLGLLKAAVIAAGIVPPSLEGHGGDLAPLLGRIAGTGRGLELISHVRDIPKGSRLAVSTNLLGSLIAVAIRATGQTGSLQGPLQEEERRVVAARAILGEWLGGSGGGWQDSGGLWPGAKLITGQLAGPGDPEYGTSRGRLLPGHRLLGDDELSPDFARRLQRSLVLVHGGMAQNVGPVLEMVTEKYLLRSAHEWSCRQQAVSILDSVVQAVRNGDFRALGSFTARNFEQPLQGIIPGASNLFTERLIEAARARFGADYWGFCMLGGMSGGGMGFWFAPRVIEQARDAMREILIETKRQLHHALPFAMEPVVYDFEVNRLGTVCDYRPAAEAALPRAYRRLHDGDGDTQDPGNGNSNGNASGERLEVLLRESGFDRELHERIRADLRSGRIGLRQNRLPAATRIEDAAVEDVTDALGGLPAARAIGVEALERGAVAVVTLAAGAGSRWTQGAGVVKGLHPFARLGGGHRSFLEVHLAKTRRSARGHGRPIPHVLTTSLFTHDAIDRWLRDRDADPLVPVRLSPGRSVGLRMIPTERDLRFAWQETARQQLDERAQKVLESAQAALITWARDAGEAADYTDNVARQCLHPVGHWFEVPNLLRNGVLAALLEQHPDLEYLLLHNVDTLGAWLDPELLGHHIESGRGLTFEVVPRQIDDRGGGLARIDHRPRLIEGLALPREEDEFALSFYNSMTTWISIPALLTTFGLERRDLACGDTVAAAVRRLAERMPTYVTLKEVKKRWGHGHEDVFPVTQFEKLWSDMTALDDVSCGYLVVPRTRGQQLKEPAQLDGWIRDGSADRVAGLCAWD